MEYDSDKWRQQQSWEIKQTHRRLETWYPAWRLRKMNCMFNAKDKRAPEEKNRCPWHSVHTPYDQQALQEQMVHYLQAQTKIKNTLEGE